jgi:type VI secretion system protein ImpK
VNGALLSGESFLLTAFREFYHEVVRLKGVVTAAGNAPDTPGAPADPSPTPAALRPEARVNAVRQELTALLERQAAAAARGGGYGAEVYGQAQYLMAALGDEVFLNLDWPGSELWRSNLLEKKLFGTHHAGEEVFKRLDTILTSRDPIYLDLAKVYLFALALGFAGRYRGLEGAATLANYRRNLFNFLANREPELLTGPAHLFPEAYASTLDEGEPTRLPRLRFWIGMAAALVLTWLLVSYQLWQGLMEHLEPSVRKILGGGW